VNRNAAAAIKGMRAWRTSQIISLSTFSISIGRSPRPTKWTISETPREQGLERNNEDEATCDKRHFHAWKWNMLYQNRGTNSGVEHTCQQRLRGPSLLIEAMEKNEGNFLTTGNV
jgi:hypothetical protein